MTVKGYEITTVHQGFVTVREAAKIGFITSFVRQRKGYEDGSRQGAMHGTHQSRQPCGQPSLKRVLKARVMDEISRIF